MKTADLPNEKASEPGEEARQPLAETKMPPHGQNQSKKLTFAKDVDLSEKEPSQRSSQYKDVLSQPPTELSHSEKLIWLQKRRTAGLWAQCDDCDRWRFLPEVLDRHELPNKWYCRLNPDKDFASCSVAEAPLRPHDEEDLIHSEYAAGSLVWARMAGWPWWPAMVDDCPDAEQYYWLDGFSDIPTHYNVVFFDTIDVTRAWISPENLRPYACHKKSFKNVSQYKKYKSRLQAAMSQADAADAMSLERRLEKYSFIARHKGNIVSPKKLKKSDLRKYQRQFKRKFNIDFPIESSESEDDNTNTENKQKRNDNVIILGTPKRAKRQKSCITNIDTEKDEKTSDKQPEKPNNIQAQNSVNRDSIANTDKPTNSMVVEIGSTEAEKIGSTEAETIDNDTSTTYVPENSTQPFEISVRMDTPNSDDFDF